MKNYCLFLFLKISTFIFVLVLSLSSFSQCPVPDPLVTGGCSYASSNLSLSASGSSGFYNWYNFPTGGTAIGTGTSFQTPILSSTSTYYVSATDTNTGLLFDGTNDYVALNMSYNTVGQINQLTLEAWINTTESDTGTFDNWSIIDFDRSEYYNFFVRGDNGQVGFSTTDNGGTIHDFYSPTSVNDGNWHHIVAVYDGTDKIIYVDGLEVARSVNAHGGNNLGSGSTRFGFIGDGSEATSFNGVRNNLYYNGSIDEIRIWNTVRTPTQINNFRDTCLVGNELGLVAYYNMNESSGSIVTDATGGGANGTLFNFNLLSAWVAGATISCLCESARIPVVAAIGNSLSDNKLSCSNMMATLDAGSGFSSYLWSTGATTQTLNTNQAGIYSVTTTGTCSGTDTVSVVGFTHSENALAFDGANDYVAIENMFYQGSYTEFTVETWLRVTNSGSQIIASFDRSEYWRLEINGDGAGAGQIGFDINTSSGILDFGSTIRVDDGNWHHVAGVFDNGTVNIYIDGVLDATTTTGSTFGSGTTRYGFLGTGSEASSYNGTRGPNNHFRGDLDEVKIWSVARNQTEIRQNMTKHIAGNEANLELYYKFDENSGNTVNDYSTSIIQNAAMFNFGAGARIVSGTPMGDESVVLYPATWAAQTSVISSCDGETLTLSNMTGNPSGVHMYFFNTVPNTTTGIVGLGSNNRYFGIFKVNDVAATYTATYNYTGNPHVGSASEPTVELFKRNDNADATWVNTGAILNTAANTVIATAQGTEFILGSSGIPLPVTLLSFEANANNDRVDLKWVTSTEINNDFFTIERSSDAKNWEEIITTNGAGNSNQVLEYFETDLEPLEGVSYYRLKQTNFDGQYEYFSIVPVRFESNNVTGNMSLFPSPVNAGEAVNVEFKGITETELLVVLRDIRGREFYSKMIVNIENGKLVGVPIDLKIPAGVYLITASSENQIYSKKLVIK
jgi:Concanavalin A-like lectin/glucanases superfamily/Ig-like domain CHU_C associated